MKRILLTWSGLVIFCITWSQEIKPSEQAQGFMNLKNTSVDYCLGLFSYKIPLFELSSGSYRLPVFLSYTGKGVKVQDKPGICGYNWQLICGGVVTRTLRGGLPDEESNGRAFHNYDVYTDSLCKLVNKHEIDGESDIFTAVFNGKQISFILEASGKFDEVRAVPLEKTGIKIEYVHRANGRTWCLTDEDGVVYEFGNREVTSNVKLEEGVTFNSVKNIGYISAWYLTKIIIPSGREICFTYSKNITTNYFFTSKMTYRYGRPVKEYTFSLKPYKTQLAQLYSLAEQHAMAAKYDFYAIREMLGKIERLEYLTQCVSNYNVLMYQEKLFLMYHKCMGMVADLSSLSESSLEAISELGNCIDYLRRISEMSPAGNGHILAALARTLESIKSIYIEAYLTAEEKYEQETSTGQQYKVSSALLTKVTCGDQELVLEYDNGNTLNSLKLYSSLHDLIGQVVLTQEGGRLTKVCFEDNLGENSQEQYFSYYGGNFSSYKADLWGYYSDNAGSGGEGYTTYRFIDSRVRVDSAFVFGINAKCNSLKMIRTSLGGEIQIDYEPNFVSYGGGLDYGERGFSQSLVSYPYGGIRVKNLISRDGFGRADTIRYCYNTEAGYSSGVFVLDGAFASRELKYRGSSVVDYVKFSDLQLNGTAVLNTGNNGVMYTYVVEERVGQGKTAYYYHVPWNAVYKIRFSGGYGYWACGLPLGCVDYDKDGRMVRMEKNYYHASLPPDCNYYTSPEFVNASSVPFPFAGKKRQLKPFGFYMDRNEVEKYYKGQRDFVVCKSPVRTISPYYDLYLPNISPRVDVNVPDQRYTLYYGGKTVLREKQEYIFDLSGSVQQEGPKYEDLFMNPVSSCILNKVNYFYGQNHVNPVLTVRQQSNGDVYHLFTRRIADAVNVSDMPECVDMVALNMIDFPVSEQLYITRNNVTSLVSEQVFRYVADTMNGKKSYLPNENHVLQLESPVETALPSVATLNKVYSCPREQYESTKFSHAREGDFFHVVQTTSKSASSVIRHDPITGRELLYARNVRYAEIAAMDRFRALRLTEAQVQAIDDGYVPEFYLVSEYGNSDLFFKDFISMCDTLASLQTTPPDVRELFYYYMFFPIREYAKRFYAKEPYKNLDSLRNVLLSCLSSTVYEHSCRAFLANTPDVPARIRNLFVTCVYIVLYNVFYFTEDVYQLRGVTLNRELTGVDLPDKLIVDVGKNLHYILALVIRGKNNFTENINYRVVYKGGNSRDFTTEIPVDTAIWQARSLDIDLTGVVDKDNIERLEVRLPSRVGEAGKRVRGAVLGVLAPVGVEFKALCRDWRGWVFCELDHQLQLKRFEYDGGGRVVRIFDAQGRVVTENNYHESSR